MTISPADVHTQGRVYSDSKGNRRVNAIVDFPNNVHQFEPGLLVLKGPYPTGAAVEYLDLLVFSIIDGQYHEIDGIRCMGCKLIQTDDFDLLIVFKGSAELHTKEKEKHHILAALIAAYEAASGFKQ